MSEAEKKEYQALIDAVHKGDPNELRALFANDPKQKEAVNLPIFSFGAPSLVFAAKKSNQDLVDILLEAGADINLKSDWEPGPYSPLHHVTGGSISTDFDMARHLISKGAEIDIHSAAGLGRMDLIEKFVSEDSEAVHSRGPDGQMPLHMSANVEIAKFFLDNGADINACCIDHNSTAAQYAVSFRPEVTKFLIENGAESDFFLAIGLGDEDLVKKYLADDPSLISTKIDEESYGPGKKGNIYCFALGYNATPLHTAAHRNHPQLVEILVEAGLDVNVRGDYDDSTPLHTAAWNGHIEMAEKLLNSGADIEINSGEIHQTSPVCWATVSGKPKMVRFLLDKGAKVLDYYLDTAKAGVSGAFAEYAGGTHKDYKELVEIFNSA